MDWEELEDIVLENAMRVNVRYLRNLVNQLTIV